MTFDESSPLPDDFQAAVVAQLAVVGYSVISWEETGVNVRATANGDGDEQYIGLANLHRRANAVDRSEWPELIRGFLQRLASAKSQNIPDDISTVADRIRPRLGRPFDRTQPHPWGIPLPGTGLEITLVIDFPHTMAYVTDDMLKKSRKKGEDLLDIALENLRSATPADYFERASDELDIYLGSLGDAYDATRALLVEELMPDSPAGFWVAIPSREELVVWPVTFAALERVHVLKLFAEENHREHAYPITDEVFWVWNGTWYHFGITLKDNDLVIDAPDPFGEALQELQGEE